MTNTHKRIYINKVHDVQSSFAPFRLGYGDGLAGDCCQMILAEFYHLLKDFSLALSQETSFLGVGQIVDLVLDWRISGNRPHAFSCFCWTIVGQRFYINFFSSALLHNTCADWHLRPSLLHVYVEICGSRPVYDSFQELVAVRSRNLRESLEEQRLRESFLNLYGAAFRMWLLHSCSFSRGAKRQIMWHTFIAKFHGLSRSGIRQLSQFALLAPLTSLDRHWNDLLTRYDGLTRYPNHRHSAISKTILVGFLCDITKLITYCVCNIYITQPTVHSCKVSVITYLWLPVSFTMVWS